ncbi:hypothetical protein PCASD_16623 [Puccinia coronata f. sp. avenae]|uniref:Methyltransferase domain-containing protein n=1 Tax=Puccinia coronata f. sp. avenae TaxID=200324 RepID=A0A2N5T3Q4_9BASI|nr:hypothetical protein PCASD_16623 [Puccinia coronata f. sp. avenae]
MMTQESPAIPGVGRKQTNYLLGRGFTESKRLSDQHEVLLKAAGGYIPVPLSTKCEMLEAILDVGTGNGAWLLGLRQSGIIPPSVELYGVDISDKMMPSKELVRKLGINLQPGGTIVIMYPGEVPYDHQTEKPLGIDTAPGRLFSAFLQYTASAGLPRQAVATLPKLLLEAGFDPESIAITTKRINLGSAEPDSDLRPASAHHLDFVLELMCNLTSFSQHGFPSSEDPIGWEKLIDGWREATEAGFFYDLCILSARNPKL